MTPIRRWLHGLALRLGRTVEELLASMSARELEDWIEYYRVEPWDEQRADLRAGIVAATVANANRGKGTRAFEPNDFMPYAPERKSASVDEQVLKAFGVDKS